MTNKSTILSLFLMMILLCSSAVSAQYHFELTPAISVSEEYDDNLYLESDNEVSDYITSVSPGITLSVLSQNTLLDLAYSPTFVWYEDEDENDTVRHSATLTFSQHLSEHVTFDLSDTYLKSEDPLEDTEEVEGVRTTRNTYERNSGSASLTLLFGPENALTGGYRHTLLENEDITLDDGTTQNPFGSLSYWFNVKNGIELSYDYTKAEFTRDDASLPGDDYTGHGAGIRYIHRFRPHTRGSVGYDYTTRDFDGLEEDYAVHEGSIGYEHDFSPDFSISLGVGYFVQKNDYSEDENGATLDASLSKRFERGSITINGSSGWDEAYLEAERRGFTRYWSGEARLEYQILGPLAGYLGGSYRWDEDEIDREWDTVRGNCGLTLSFLRWFSTSIDYEYAERDDDVDTDDYELNRVTLMFTATKLFRW
ncbi:MAG: outer membrane beta-barrel protein [Thermodesulfobacteriota bacterium]|nr:outer membrane beta-barrel protein [Thermodesulfobacteriota bacterium]